MAWWSPVGPLMETRQSSYPPPSGNQGRSRISERALSGIAIAISSFVLVNGLKRCQAVAFCGFSPNGETVAKKCLKSADMKIVWGLDRSTRTP